MTATLCAACSLAQITTYPNVPNVLTSSAAGDTLCALGGDITVGAQTITGGSSTASTITVNMSSVPGYFFPGAVITVNNASPSGFNVTSAAITATDGATYVTFSSTNNPGNWSSSGTVAMACSNATDSTATTSTFANTINVAANAIQQGWTQRITGGTLTFSTSTPPPFNIQLRYGVSAGAVLFSNSLTLTPTASAAGYNGGIGWDLFGLSSSAIETHWNGLALPTTTATNNQTQSYNLNGVAYALTTNVAKTLNVRLSYNKTGVSTSAGTITYSSGSSACTASTNQLATATNGGGTGAVGLVAINGSGVPTGTLSIGPSYAGTSTGQGYASIPTTWTIATCTGTGTFTTSGTLGGAQGNAVLLLGLVGRQ